MPRDFYQTKAIFLFVELEDANCTRYFVEPPWSLEARVCLQGLVLVVVAVRDRQSIGLRQLEECFRAQHVCSGKDGCNEIIAIGLGDKGRQMSRSGLVAVDSRTIAVV